MARGVPRHTLSPVARDYVVRTDTMWRGSKLTRLSAIMIRRQTSRLATSASGAMQRISLGFEH